MGPPESSNGLMKFISQAICPEVREILQNFGPDEIEIRKNKINYFDWPVMHTCMLVIIPNSQSLMETVLTIWMRFLPNFTLGHTSAAIRAADLSFGAPESARRETADGGIGRSRGGVETEE